VPVTPSADTGAPPPSVGFATYNPQTGQYGAPDGNVYTQTDLAQPPAQGWKDLLPR
jgi:hypothetical protein